MHVILQKNRRITCNDK
uniref:Uncharacterized protein n=1 Tax=Rhizophora mucronata TaxID=61149 RepID=A0A2P2M0D3_RHIMU